MEKLSTMATQHFCGCAECNSFVCHHLGPGAFAIRSCAVELWTKAFIDIQHAPLHLLCAPCLRSVVLPQGMKERPVSVLASADAAGVVVLSICGAYRLITIDLRAHRAVDEKGKGRGSVGSRSSPAKPDSPRQRRSRRSPGQDGAGGAGLTESDGDGDGDGAEQGVRPLQLTLSSDLSLLSALIEVDGHIELVQVRGDWRWRKIGHCTRRRMYLYRACAWCEVQLFTWFQCRVSSLLVLAGVNTPRFDGLYYLAGIGGPATALAATARAQALGDAVHSFQGGHWPFDDVRAAHASAVD